MEVIDIPYEGYEWDRGAFRQRDRTPRVTYDAAYLERQSGTPESHRALAELRLRVLEAFVPRGGELLDFGCGRGDFLRVARRADWNAWGCDVVPGEGLLWPEVALRAGPWDVVCFFDSLEHLSDPADVVRTLGARWLYVSLPECHYPDNPDWFMRYYHRRPGEHLFHWNRQGLDEWMGHLGYRPVLHAWHEDRIRTPYDPTLPNVLTAIYQRG